MLRRNCFLKHIIEGTIKRGIEVTGRQGWRIRQLLDDCKERKWYWKLKEEALDRTSWRIGFGRGYKPVVRETTEIIDFVLLLFIFQVVKKINF
jgi:hypothetical protein